MKRIILISAFAVLCLASCQTEVIDFSGNEANSTVKAHVLDTRTSMELKSAGVYKINWEDSDVVNANGISSSSINLDDGASSAVFTFDGELSDPVDMVYPASVVTSYSARKASISLPATQTYKEGTFDPASAIVVGSGTLEGGVALAHEMAYLKISPDMGTAHSGQKIKSLTLTTVAEAVSGAFSIDFTASPSMSPATEGTSRSISVNCGTEGVASGEGILVAVPAQTYTAGMTISLTASDECVYSTVSKKDLTAEAGRIYPLPVAFDPAVTVSDTKLQEILLRDFDANSDGILTRNEAKEIETVACANSGVTTLSGIEQLPNVKTIYADHNPIANVSISGMAKLEELNVSFSTVPLESLNLTNLPSLKILYANDGAYVPGTDNTLITSLTLDLPSLERININLWHSLQSLDISKCTNLKYFDGCQLYRLASLDLSKQTKLENCFAPDLFDATELKLNSASLKTLSAWNTRTATTVDLSSCTALEECIMNDCNALQSITFNTTALRNLNLNVCRELLSLDISKCVNIENLNIIQLYKAATIALPTDLSKLNVCWMADALVVKELTFKNVNSTARVSIWNCPALETLNYDSKQTTIGWEYDLGENGNPNNVTGQWSHPGDNIKTFNLTAPNCTRLYCSNLHALEGVFDLTDCPNLEFICAPDLWVVEGFDFSKCTKLSTAQLWNANEITSIDFSNCAEAMNEVNVGTGDGKCDKLQKLILRTGQTITTIFKDDSVVIEYK